MPTLPTTETAAEAAARMGCDKRYLLKRAGQAYDGGLNGLVKALVLHGRANGGGSAWCWEAPAAEWDRIRALPVPRQRSVRDETLAKGAEVLEDRPSTTHQPVRWGKATMWLKACPKCGGDLIRSRWRADDVACLQCGRELRPAELAALEGQRRL